mgnify:CR=1 FL=1
MLPHYIFCCRKINLKPFIVEFLLKDSYWLNFMNQLILCWYVLCELSVSRSRFHVIGSILVVTKDIMVTFIPYFRPEFWYLIPKFFEILIPDPKSFEILISDPKIFRNFDFWSYSNATIPDPWFQSRDPLLRPCGIPGRGLSQEVSAG